MFRITLVLVAAALGAAVHVAAQAAGPPNDRAAEYRSAFADYRPFKEQPVAPWRDVNREVGLVGGHAGSIVQQPIPRAPAAPTSPSTPGAPADVAVPPHRGQR